MREMSGTGRAVWVHAHSGHYDAQTILTTTSNQFRTAHQALKPP